MEQTAPKHTHYTMTNLSWEITRMMLTQAGWATTPAAIVTSAALEEKLDDPTKPKPAADGKPDKAADKQWGDLLRTVDLTAKEHATIAKCIKHHVERGHLGGARENASIVATFLPDET